MIYDILLDQRHAELIDKLDDMHDTLIDFGRRQVVTMETKETGLQQEDQNSC